MKTKSGPECPGCKGTGEVSDDTKEGSMRLFKLNDCDWYMAHTLEEAIEAIRKDLGTLCDIDDLVDCPEEVSEADMQRLRFVAEDMPEATFAEQFAREVERDGTTARAFATTEY